MNPFALLALAIAPSAALGFAIYWNDEHEKEPVRLIRKSFMFGVLSILVTSILSLVTTPFFGVGIDGSPLDSLRYHPVLMAYFAFLGVGLVEEFSKWIMLKVKIVNWVNFNEPYDGILYSVMVSLGFATFENIMYVFGAEAVEPRGGLVTGILRMFTAVPAHTMFAVIMGYYMGKYKFEEEHKGRNLALSLIVPTLFHGAYDYFAFLDWIPGIFVGAFVSLLVGIFYAIKAIKIHQDNSPFHPSKISSATTETAEDIQF